MNSIRHFITLAAVAASITMLSGGSPAFAQKKAPKTKFTAEQANAVAVKKFGGKVVGKSPLENEDGKWQYAVMVQSGKALREVMVDAQTGKIDTVEVTTKAKEGAEAKAEAAKAKKKGGEKEEEDDEQDEKSGKHKGAKGKSGGK